MTKTIDFYYSL